MWKVYIVYPNGRRRLAGGVKGYRTRATAEAAYHHYKKFVRRGRRSTYRGCTVELVQA